MRRITSTVLIGLGAFLIMAAVLVKFYAYPNLAVVPSDYESTTALEAKGATIFSAADLATAQTDLTITSYTYANPDADPPSGYADWVGATTITRDDIPGATCDVSVDAAKPGCFQQSGDASAFDNQTGVAATEEQCPAAECPSTYDATKIVAEDYVLDVKPITREGHIYKMDFNTPKKDVMWWDSSIQEATPMAYTGEEKIDGLTTYKFVQEIEPTNIGNQDLPGKVFGLPDATVTADVLYSMTRTLWIEPRSGSPMDREEIRTQTFSYDGQSVDAFVGTVAYTDDQVASNVKDGKSQAFLLKGLAFTFPIVMILLGLIAIAGGVLLRRGGRKPAEPTQGKRELVNA